MSRTGLGNLPDDERCTGTKSNGLPCPNPRMTGLTVCSTHGGLSPRARAKSQRAKAEKFIMTRMEKFVTPLDEDDIRAHPLEAFKMEMRRTVARIIWYDEEIAALEDPDKLIFGKTKEEDIDASEYPGVNKTYEARAHQFHVLQMAERKHLLELEKIWIGAKLGEAAIKIEQDKVALLNAAITGILTKLGHNVLDPTVRQVVREQLLSLPA